MIAIAKVVQDKAKVIVFDEPTALLANEETKELFSLIKKLKQTGVGIIYISHRMEEIFEICDMVTVLKDGHLVKTIPITETNNDQLISLMVGRSMEDMYQIEIAEKGDVILEVKNLSCRGKFSDISFSLKKGEILGLFGLVGSGRTELMHCIYGAQKYDSGEITMYGTPLRASNPREAIRRGLGLLPEDRKTQGLAMKLDVAVNINLAAYDKVSRNGLLNLMKERKTAERYVEELQIKTPSIKQKVKNLSGGNQQKVVISRWLNRGSEILIFDEPTVGVDVGTKREIYKIFENLTKKGNSIIIVSSYLPEIMGVADKAVTMREGKQTGVIERNDFNEELLLKYATTLNSEEIKQR
ncbi:MAG: sugar ABC transporter ATP-binding protein [Holosporales bacterium]|jgi:ribose transport system ATP-binding protein|nr:sugar ABC transporter ATP-binding protein [Holosporales bacterium]